MDWEECCNKRIAKSVKPDLEMIKSLIKSSENKFLSENQLKMDDITAISKISLAYDSLRELLEALALKRGYKIYNHECYTAFLKEIIEESDKGEDYDEIRKTRNDINYYGKGISLGEARKVIERIKNLRSFVLGLLKNNKNQ